MTKEFKILKLTVSKDGDSGLATLLALLSEIEDIEIEIEEVDFIPQIFNPTKGIYFILDSKSDEANYLLDSPEERKCIDMSLYQQSNFFLDNKLEKAFKLIPPQNPDPSHWTNIDAVV